MKTLYFEGAGSSDTARSDVENCRIRTAFANNDGQKIYFETSGHEITDKHQKKLHPGIKFLGMIDSCHYEIEGKNENETGIKGMRHRTFEYTKANILGIVNSLRCDFDEIVILPHLAGYRVFKSDNCKGLNYGDEFIFNAELTARAQEIEKHFYALERAEGKRYPNCSVWVDQQDREVLHLLRHFNGYNKHWTIRNVPNWQETIEEAILGKYAC